MSGMPGQEKLSGIFRALADRTDWQITLVRSAEEFTAARVRAACADGYDGFVVSIPNATDALAALAETDIPTVVADVHEPSLDARKSNIVFLGCSAEEIGRRAADHLLSTGRCRSYAFVHASPKTEWSVRRAAAFGQVLRGMGCACRQLDEPEELAQLEGPVGVFAANDDRAFEVLAACRRHRLRVPADVLVLGVDNDVLLCEHAQPSLSSVWPDFEGAGAAAVRELDRLMAARQAGGAPVPREKIAVGVRDVVCRGSTASVSPGGKLVQRALAYIQKNARCDISVEDVVAHMKVSRRLADLRFRELQGMTIGETIIRARLQEVKRRLSATDEPIEQVAYACGYQNPNYLKNLFKRRFAMTMRKFREVSRASGDEVAGSADGKFL